MKFCPNCGKQADDAARFCSNCGNVFAENAPAAAESEKSEKTVFIAPDAVQPQYQAPQQPQAPVQPQYQAPVQPQAPAQPQYQAPVQPQYQVPQQSQIPAEPPKKKMNVGVLVAIIVAVLLVVAAGVLLILDATETIDFIDIISSSEEKDEDKDDDKDDEDESDEDKSDEDKSDEDKTEAATKAPEKETEALVTEVETTEKAEEETSRVPVTSGNDFYSSYVNIILEAPAGFSRLSDSEIGALPSEMLEAAIIMKETDTETYMLSFACYDKDAAGCTAQELLEADVNSSVSGYDAEAVEYDTDEYTTSFAGNDAYCCDIEAYDDVNEVDYYESFCVYEEGDYIIELFVYGVALDSVDDAVLSDMFDAVIVD